MNPDLPFDADFIELDQQLSGLDWVPASPSPVAVPVKEITERALLEHSVKSLGDFAFTGMGKPLAEIIALLLSGHPLPSDDDYQV